MSLPDFEPILFGLITGGVILLPLIVAILGTLVFIWLGVNEAVAAVCATLIALFIALHM